MARTAKPKRYPFNDTALPRAERINDLIGRLTLKEKIGLMLHDSHGVRRLGIPSYNWCNEALHGVAHAGTATVLPQAMGLAATFDPRLVKRCMAAVADEARAKHHAFAARGERGYHVGLNFWSPNVNLFRDPRWGRGQETYGEDPYLSGEIGAAFVKGLQGPDRDRVKCIATPKHYAVHSGPEKGRHEFDAKVSPKDMRETYLPAFRTCVKKGGALGIMGAYNRTNGEACCAHPRLLHEILRESWKFDGHVVSDCNAIRDIWQNHKNVKTPAEAAALAIKRGCDLNCGRTYAHALEAKKQGLLTDADIDTALYRVLDARFRLGMFDPPARQPYAGIPLSVVNCPAHRKLARQAARESMVLLKNKNGILPLDKRKLKQVLMVGPQADSIEGLLGNYNGVNPRLVTPMEGVVDALGPDTAVLYKHGCDVAGNNTNGFNYASILADTFDAIIVVLGLTIQVEGEEGVAMHAPDGADRLDLRLPGVQEQLLGTIHAKAKGRPVVLVLTGGSPVTLGKAEQYADAIIHMWYPGEEGGNALADVLFGGYAPAGRLPVTFPESVSRLPKYESYAMKGRTYRYTNRTPAYPFGYGLGYTTFKYSGLKLSSKNVPTGTGLAASVTVKNTGKRASDETVQLYVTRQKAATPQPHWSLKGIDRINLKPGASKKVTFKITPEDLGWFDKDGTWINDDGTYTVYVGGQQPDARSAELTGNEVLSADFRVKGEKRVLKF